MQAMEKMSENKVNGPEEAVVSEMSKQLPQGEIHIITKCFQERFMGQMEAPSSWKFVKLVFFTKTRSRTKERDQKLQSHCFDIGYVDVVRIMYYSSSGNKERT